MKKNEKGVRFSVYFYPEQIEWLDKEGGKAECQPLKVY